jgi:hypothetical protein
LVERLADGIASSRFHSRSLPRVAVTKASLMTQVAGGYVVRMAFAPAGFFEYLLVGPL